MLKREQKSTQRSKMCSNQFKEVGLMVWVIISNELSSTKSYFQVLPNKNGWVLYSTAFTYDLDNKWVDEI